MTNFGGGALARPDGVGGADDDCGGHDNLPTHGAWRGLESGRAFRVNLDEVVDRAKRVMQLSDDVLRTAQRLSQDARELRPTADRALWPRFFVIHGRVDGERVRGSWFRGELYASKALRVRADLLIRMGETFRMERDGPPVAAGLSEPLAAMLTLIRSCDRLANASFGPVGYARKPVRYGS